MRPGGTILNTPTVATHGLMCPSWSTVWRKVCTTMCAIKSPAKTNCTSSCPTIRATPIPARGTRPVDADTGDQGGTTEGVFVSEWRGDVLYGRNEAVGGHYILAYAESPEGDLKAELWGDEQWQLLKSVVEEYKPRVIGIDRDLADPTAYVDTATRWQLRRP